MKTLKAALRELEIRGAIPEWVGFRRMREKTTLRQVRDGKPQANAVYFTEGVMAEALVQGQFAYCAVPSLETEALVQAAKRAALLAERASRWRIHSFTPAERPALSEKITRAFPSQWKASPSAEVQNELLIEISNRIRRSPKIVRSIAYIQFVETEIDWVSSNGAEASQSFSLVTSDCEATAQEGNVIQRRTLGGARGHSYQGGWERVFVRNHVNNHIHDHWPDLWESVDQVREQALELLSAEECPTETLPLVLAPDQMMLQIHESIGHPLELDRILGDERNYAGWSFVQPQDFGKLQYGSPILNVTFDPTVPGEFACYAMDDSGAPATREYLIRNGVLERGLGGLESQARLGLPGVANSRASSWNRAPIDRMANLNVEPGSSTLQDILSGIERGVWMESNRSWSIDDFRNKFQFGCEYAKLIENGKLTRTLRNPNYRGSTLAFWRGLKKVGNASTFRIYGTPNCGKGEPNQVIRVGHASPVCQFENVEVFGGAAGGTQQ